MRNRWLPLVVMALALGAFGGGNNRSGEQLAAAAISTSMATTQYPTTETTAMTTQPRPRSTVSYRVTPGDNLWSIAKHHLAVSHKRSPKEFSNRKIAGYWLKVVAINARRLNSGDPDLIYPGETIVLPPVALAPTRPAPADQPQLGTPAPGPTTTTTGPPPTGTTTSTTTTIGSTVTTGTTTTTGPTTTGPATTGPATTGTTPPTATRRPPPYEFEPSTPAPTNPPGQPGPDEPGSGEDRTTPEPGQETSHPVVTGDNLWTIARGRLVEALGGGRRPTNRQVASYWLQVIEANRHRLRSGDPDLIYPGETIALPPVD
jgi:nucleoid-associated protein YgaU